MTTCKLSICNVICRKLSSFSIKVIHNSRSFNHFFNQGNWQGNLTTCKMIICTCQRCSVSCILNVKQKLGLLQKVFPIFSMNAIIISLSYDFQNVREILYVKFFHYCLKMSKSRIENMLFMLWLLHISVLAYKTLHHT